ncbi:uncharacterized protein LOC142355416, partial [Convolutriloba macropyga]|uniref:uncharacterized protein LOC142355416 n=1 Tax=Convolutriloba macropyga TaxID=536237 RepID=UPI003F521864
MILLLFTLSAISSLSEGTDVPKRHSGGEWKINRPFLAFIYSDENNFQYLGTIIKEDIVLTKRNWWFEEMYVFIRDNYTTDFLYRGGVKKEDLIKVVEFIHLDQDPDNIDLSKDLSLMRLEKKLSPDKVLKPCEYLDYSSLLYDLALYSIYDPEMSTLLPFRVSEGYFYEIVKSSSSASACHQWGREDGFDFTHLICMKRIYGEQDSFSQYDK